MDRRAWERGWIEVSFFLCFAHVSLSNWFPTIQITNCPNIAVYLYSFLALTNVNKVV